MAIAIQKTPYMHLLNTEQVMDGYCIKRRIEAAQQTKSLLVRFFSIKKGTDIWIDGLEYVDCGSDMELFLSVFCELSNEDAELVSKSWEIINVDGFAEKLCWNTTGFDWQKYYTLNGLLVYYSEEVISACIASGIPLEELGDKYQGHFNDENDFYRERFLELNYGFPKCYIQYIDWDKVAEIDGQSYINTDGYIFDAR